MESYFRKESDCNEQGVKLKSWESEPGDATVSSCIRLARFGDTNVAKDGNHKMCSRTPRILQSITVC